MAAHLSLIAIDILAICVLTFGIYFPRHRRTDLAIAFIGVNVCVLAVSQVLASSTVGAGLGLGLFGVLSIIRLRSSEISQREVAYYFAALALGLIAGLTATLSVLSITMMALIVAALAAIDSPLLDRYTTHTQIIQLDRAIADEYTLRREVEALAGGTVVSLSVQKVDLVNDLTLVEVRLRPGVPVVAEQPVLASH